MGLENPTHWIPIIVILLLVFGAKRLPEIGRSLGSGLREFKQSINGESHGDGHDREPPTLNAGPAQAHTPTTPVQEQEQEPLPQRDPAATDRR
jgi:sec-independent protein translocase protein TatA